MSNLSSERRPVPGSERKPLAGASAKDLVAGDEQLTATVLVRRRAELPAADSGSAPIERSEFAASYGADPADVKKVESFASDRGLRVGEVNLAARTVSLSGSADAFSAAFGVELRHYERGSIGYRGREGAITVPSELDGIVKGVFGMDNRRLARPHFRFYESAEADGGGSFKPTQVAELYGFADEASGEGECIGLVELGGGFRQEDVDLFFGSIGVDKSPKVIAVELEDATNDFADGGNANGEVALDIQVAGALAPRTDIAVYFAPNTDQGFLAAINGAIHDSTNRPSIISISWGAPENEWTPQAMTAFDEAFADAAKLGISVFAASGDQGSADRLQYEEDPNGLARANPAYDGKAHANFPSSSPHVTACGGTRLTAEGEAIASETAWNDGNGWATGGGVSDFFSLPEWQEDAGVPASINPPGKRVGRGVPDVAGDADGETGYQIYVGGKKTIIGGTSAVAPLWAGMTARLNQARGRRLGFLNPILYTAAAKACFRPVTQGDNEVPANGDQPATRGYEAGSGWNACAGLGTPVGAELRTLFVASAQAPPASTMLPPN
jgi:kumamolisin